jgi:hypothetical protein
MGIQSIERETIPCPPPDECVPESGEYSAKSVLAPVRASDVAPLHIGMIDEKIRDRLAGVICPTHGQLAGAELLIDDYGAVQTVPVVCCDELDRLVRDALRESITLAPPAFPELAIQRLPR